MFKISHTVLPQRLGVLLSECSRGNEQLYDTFFRIWQWTARQQKSVELLGLQVSLQSCPTSHLRSTRVRDTTTLPRRPATRRSRTVHSACRRNKTCRNACKYICSPRSLSRCTSQDNVVAPTLAAPLLIDTSRSTVGSGTRENKCDKARCDEGYSEKWEVVTTKRCFANLKIGNEKLLVGQPVPVELVAACPSNSAQRKQERIREKQVKNSQNIACYQTK